MRSITLVVLVFVVIGLLTSCEKSTDNPQSDTQLVFKNTIFTAKPTNAEESVNSPISKNHTNENPPKYSMKHEFGNLGIEVGYQYIGNGIVDDNSKVDVYLISLKVGDKPTEYQAIYYDGTSKVIDYPEIQISFHQD